MHSIGGRRWPRPRRARQCERDVFGLMLARAHCNDDVLLALMHVRHRRAGRLRRQLDLGDHGAGRLS